MGQELIRIAITGGAGQIAYSLLFRIAAGELFGPKTPIALHFLEIPEMVGQLEGLKMELEDSAFSTVQEVKVGSDPYEIFEGIDIAFLVGAKPRGPGMERKDLLLENAKIFSAQGKALNKVANRNVQVLVVGNPCNTNCLIAIHNAPDLHPRQFTSMMRLDQNRAASMLAKRAKVSVDDISNMTVWGNHSTTQVPDFYNAKISGKPAIEVINDIPWLENEFIKAVQQRGAEVIKARGKSSAGSAASSAIDAMRSLLTETPQEGRFSCAVYTKNNPYRIDEDLVFSFPCASGGNFDYSIVADVPWNSFLEEKIRLSENELKEERDLIKHLL